MSGNKLALHFGCVRQHIDQLTQQGVIERRGDGLFDQAVSRLKYLTHLRAEHRKSPKTAADAEHVAAKAALLRIQIEEKKRTLVARDEADVLLDQIADPPWSALQEPTTHESLKNRFGNPDKLAKPNNLPK